MVDFEALFNSTASKGPEKTYVILTQASFSINYLREIYIARSKWKISCQNKKSYF